MTEFKVGDRVRVVRPVEGWLSRPDSCEGREGVIEATGRTEANVRLDSPLKGYEAAEVWGFEHKELEILSHSVSNETLRDRFAMAALTGLQISDRTPFDVIVKTAYAYADAMLAERERAK